MTNSRTIEGRCNTALELILELHVINDQQQAILVDAVIDTGFSGAVSVPKAVVDQLNLVFARRVVGNLADGSTTLVELYFARLLCGERLVDTEIAAAGTQALIGVQFLAGQRLTADFVLDGSVKLVPIPP